MPPRTYRPVTTILGRLRGSTQRSIALGYRDPDFARLKADADRLAAIGRVTITPVSVYGAAFLRIDETLPARVTGCSAPATAPTTEHPQSQTS